MQKAGLNDRLRHERSEADERTTWSPRPCGLDWAHCGRVFPRCGRGRDKGCCDDCSGVKRKVRAAFESQSSDRIAESDVAEDTMSVMVKLEKDPLEP